MGLNNISYSCDDCGKEFNLQIKLRKHSQKAHVNQKDLTHSDYLDEEIVFTDDEKAYYFDDLKSKLEAVQSRVAFFKKRYNILGQTGVNESSLKEEGYNRKSKLTDSGDNELNKTRHIKKDFSECLTETYPDPYTPSGWKSGLRKGAGVANNKLYRVFESPDGKCLQSRRAEIKYATTNL